jgi:16S rRNA (adenine1518-N6/adenine1519-N6)-dimethyltransferase
MRILPRKRFGQHFLCDTGVIANIVSLLAPRASDHLIEIGPGLGALTLPVLKIVPFLDVIELDRDVVPILKEKVADPDKLHVIQQDVLTVDFSVLKTDSRTLRVFGNLPYNISTPLIFHLLEHAESIQDMTFMLQKEVADRLSAAPRTPDYGRLSVMVQYYATVELSFIVPPDAFNPPPKVFSRMVHLLPYHQNERPFVARDETVFAELVRLAFNQRRKTLRNSLKSFSRSIAFDELGELAGKRPEELSVKEFVLLANSVS